MNTKVVKKLKKDKQASSKAVMARDAPMIIAGSLLLNVLPRNLTRTLRYAETYTLTTGTVGVVGSVQQMALNSLYDPNATGTGHQPYGYDQLAPAFYLNYLVKKVRWRLLCTTIGNTSEVCVAFCIYPSGASGIQSLSVDAVTEKSNVTTFNVGPSGNDRSRLVEGHCSMDKIFGITQAQLTDNLDQYGAAYNANPTKIAYLELGIGSYSGSAGITLSVQVVLDFEAEFYSPVTLSQS